MKRRRGGIGEVYGEDGDEGRRNFDVEEVVRMTLWVVLG